MRDGHIDDYTVTPEDFGIQRRPLDGLAAGSIDESLALVNRSLEEPDSAPAEIVALNAGAAIYAADLADSLAAGIAKAATVIDSGAAREKLAALVRVSNSVCRLG